MESAVNVDGSIYESSLTAEAQREERRGRG
jgi:hypothetical protein